MAKSLSTSCYDVSNELSANRTRNRECYDSIVKQFGTLILLKVFLFSKKRDDLFEYYTKNSSKPDGKGKRGLNPYQLERLKEEPKTFDVSLLHQLLRNNDICDRLDDDPGLWQIIEKNAKQKTAQLESLLFTIAQEKNTAVSHGSIDKDFSEKRLEEKLIWFKQLCIFTLEKISKRYSDKKDISELEAFKNDMEMEISKRFKTERIIDMTKKVKKTNMKAVREYLSEKYNKECKFSIGGWLRHKRDCQPSSLYSDMLLEEYFETDDSTSKTPREIYSKDLLKETFGDLSTQLQAVVIFGPTGIGKTTLARRLQDLWVRFAIGDLKLGDSELLGKFEILLYFECKTEKSGFKNFLKKLHGGISENFPQFDQFYRWLLSTKMLIIMEGIDECRDSTTLGEVKIFLSKAGCCKLLLTTRKEGKEMIKSSELEKYLMFSIQGISMKQQFNFAKTSIEFLIEDEDIKEDLISKLETHWPTLQDHLEELLEKPLILSIVSYMWAQNPSKVNNFTSLTELMEGLRETQINDLTERVLRMALNTKSGKEITGNINTFLEIFDNISLHAYLADEYVLNKYTLSILKNVCQQFSLPLEDVFGTFLDLRNGETEEYSFVHQLFQNYSASKSILTTLLKKPLSGDKTQFLDLLKETLSELSILLKETLAVSLKEALSMLSKDSKKNKIIKEYISKSRLTDQDMDVLKDIFLHVTGMIATMPDSPQEEYATILKNSLDPSDVDMVLQHAAESWNSKNKKYNTHIIESLACILISNNEWRIWNSNCLKGLLPILELIHPKTLNLDFHHDVTSLYQLRPSLELISMQEIELSLLLHQHYLHWNGEFSDDFLKIISESKLSTLKEFKGAIRNISITSLPIYLTNLQLYIEENTVQCFYENLEQLTKLKKLVLKVRFHTHMFVEDLPADKFCGDHFELSIVSDVSNDDADCEWLADTTAEMLPRKQAHCTKKLSFLNTKLTGSGFKELMKQLIWQKICVSPLATGQLHVESTEILVNDEFKELNQMVKELGKLTLYWNKT